MSTPPLGTVRQRAALGRRFATLVLIALLPLARAQQGPEPLGRLFFTPEYRQTLDRQRQLNIRDKQEIPDDPTLTINGVVTRSSGRGTVWINGVVQRDRPDGAGVAVTPQRQHPGQLLVERHGAAATAAKVGDTVNRNTGEATDLLDGGRISRKSGNGN